MQEREELFDDLWIQPAAGDAGGALGAALVAHHPDIGAIVLECTNMPPYAARVQEALGLPVFDVVTLIHHAHNAVIRRRFSR